MISIIICSRTPSIPDSLQMNIRNTIGEYEYEIIVIDNSTCCYSLFSAYNKGASVSNYPYLCFMHDDITFNSKNWGEVVIRHLKQPDAGVLGVAGSLYKSEIPSSWWVPFEKQKFNRDYVLTVNDNHESIINLPVTCKTSEIVVLDGVWFCCRRLLWEECPFDERNYHGFHFYDLDFSLNAYLKGYKNYVTNEVFIEHNSKGNFNVDWIDSARIFHSKWREYLPISLINMCEEEEKKINLEFLKNWLGLLNRSHYKHFTKSWFFNWAQYLISNPLKIDRFSLLYQRLKIILFG